MTSKEELLKKFKEERIAREKARIQMLHDMNRKKYSKNDENAWKYKSNSSLNISDDKSPVKNSMHRRGPTFVRGINGQLKRPRVKNYSSLHSFYDNCLNVSAPVNTNTSFSKDSVPKRRSIHSATDHNVSFDYSSPTTDMTT